MKVRDLGRAILDFELSHIGRALLLSLSIVLALVYGVVKLYTRFFPLVIIGALVGFGIENFDRFYDPDYQNYYHDGGIQVSDGLFLNIYVIITIFGLCTIWPFTKLLVSKLEPVIKRMNEQR